MFNKIRAAFTRFMQGRNGPDQFTQFLFFVWLGLYILGAIVSVAVISYLGLAVGIYTIFRMFSRNVYRRGTENAKYLEITGKIRTAFAQARVRFKNRKEYKYFRCPKCHSWLKLRRGAGKGTIKCSKCQHSFEVKA